MKRTILLVDDDASLLEMLGDFLESEGYEVVKAESGEKALSTLRSLTPDIIVLDMSMPGIGGIGVLDRIMLPDGRFRYPVLVLTARARMAEYFADKQVDGFIAKPCAPEDLAMEISRIIFQTSGQVNVGEQTEDPLVYLADSAVSRRSEMAFALNDAGFKVESFATGAALIEATVLRPPVFVVMSVLLSDQPVSVIVQLLKSMTATADVKNLVYGIGMPGVSVDTVMALESRKCAVVTDNEPESVVKAIRAL